ncbi:MAG: hypothetical protein ACRD0U_04365, partial [Acidimicrobiales bacterium]
AQRPGRAPDRARYPLTARFEPKPSGAGDMIGCSGAQAALIGRVEDMHVILDAESDATLAFLDEWFARQGGRRGKSQRRTHTSGLLWARTRHATSRAADPGPHDQLLKPARLPTSMPEDPKVLSYLAVEADLLPSIVPDAREEDSEIVDACRRFDLLQWEPGHDDGRLLILLDSRIDAGWRPRHPLQPAYRFGERPLAGSSSS